MPTLVRRGSPYHRLLRNRTFLLLWSGQTVSTVGDALFNVAVMWLVYTRTHSVFQTASIQAVWHLSDVLLGPIAGAYADRLDRKKILLAGQLASAVVVGVLAFVIPHTSSLEILAAIFLLNGFATFSAPARFSVMPDIVDQDLLAHTSGLLSSVTQGASFLGNALAGVIIAVIGAGAAVTGDAASFVLAAAATTVARVPGRAVEVTYGAAPSLARQLLDGWRVAAGQPIIRSMIRLFVLINVASYMGALIPALVRLQLHSGVGAYGAVEALSVVGGMLGGLLAGRLERVFGAGHLVPLGWGLAGFCAIGMATSRWLLLTAMLEAGLAFGLVVSGVSMSAVMQVLIPDEFRGRVYGIMGSLSVIAIPLSALLGGWLADRLGPPPLFALGGLWILAIASMAAGDKHVRVARATTQPR